MGILDYPRKQVVEGDEEDRYDTLLARAVTENRPHLEPGESSKKPTADRVMPTRMPPLSPPKTPRGVMHYLQTMLM